MLLSDTQIKNAKASDKLVKLRDGGSLFLHIKPNGTKLWIMPYRWEGRQKTLSIGVYPTISLKEARIKRDEAKKLLSSGVDPSQSKKKTETSTTFEMVAREWLANWSKVWAVSHLETVEQRVSKYVLPFIGNKEIANISPQDVLELIRRIESRGTAETAKRTLGICSMIFRYGVATCRCESDPCRDLRGALVPYKSKSFAAVTKPKEVAALMRSIYDYNGYPVVQAALKFSALTFCRPGEIRQAEWKEIDFDSRVWTIPVTKMKKRAGDHIVPLARQSIEILQQLRDIGIGGIYVFPTPRTVTRCLSENAVTAALRSMGYSGEQMTAHGFRSMASTLLNELGQPYDVIETQLAHAGHDKVRAIYNRAEYMEKRIALMQFWADYLDDLRIGQP